MNMSEEDTFEMKPQNENNDPSMVEPGPEAVVTPKANSEESKTRPLEILTEPSENETQSDSTAFVPSGHNYEPDTRTSYVQETSSPQFKTTELHESNAFSLPSIDTQASLSPQGYPTSARSPQMIDAEKKTRRRGSAWTDDQTFFLMEIWARHTDASGNEEYSVTNAPIYRIISKSMSQLGYIDKTSDQCKCRIHTLKRAYKLTKAEIDSGAQNITFCRHYDKLKIIMGDDPAMTPKQLAEVLAEQRKTKGLTGASLEAKPKKLKSSPENKLKRALTSDTTSHEKPPAKQAFKSSTQQTPTTPVVPPLPAVSSLWNPQSFTFPFSVTPPTQNQAVSYSDTQYTSPVNTQSISYQSATTTTASASYDINHNTNIIVKQEKLEDGYPSYQPFIQRANETASQTKEEIERMRLDLEMKKIEMEKNRLEMEERQRREDRDHQYRMMQLLLMGLGHNSTLGSAGQGSESEEGHQPELSRALEGGLVPGGVQSANEKGLSFSEI